MKPRSSPRLSALVVNYRSGAFALACVRSLVREWAAAGWDPEELEVVVVDNASPSDQTRWLGELELLGVKVVQSSANLGYAGGIELALEYSRGDDEDYLAILNPDTWFLPGSVRTLIEYLDAHPTCGAVAPRAWLDEECSFLLPPIPLPTATREIASTLAPLSAPLARSLAGRRLAERLAWWRAELPLEAAMLSGACVFLSRAVARSLGQLLDTRYPLYYEDADLSRRIRARGLSLVLHPDAGILHHWSRSAGSGSEFEGEPRRRFQRSRAAYLERWESRLARAVLRGADRLVARWPAKRKCVPIHAFDDLGDQQLPLELELVQRAELVLEVSNSPLFPLAAGTFVAPCTRWTFPIGPWAWLFEGRYWMRAFELESLQLAGAWSFVKTTPARTWPVGLADPLAAEGRTVA